MKGHHIPHTEEAKKKIRLANTNPSPETRLKMSLSHKGQVSWRKGKKFVDEKVSKEKRKLYIKNWKLKNRDKLLKYSRDSRKRNIKKIKVYSKRHYWENREKNLSDKRYKKYGITQEEYLRIVRLQEYKCAVCFKEDKINLSVDHNHKTGKLRGIICNRCNMALGNVGDSPQVLRSLANYLEKHENA